MNMLGVGGGGEAELGLIFPSRLVLLNLKKSHLHKGITFYFSVRGHRCGREYTFPYAGGSGDDCCCCLTISLPNRGCGSGGTGSL